MNHFKQLYSWGLRGLACLVLLASVGCAKNNGIVPDAKAAPVAAQYDTLRGRVDAEFGEDTIESSYTSYTFRLVTSDSLVVLLTPSLTREVSRLLEIGDEIAVRVPQGTIRPFYDIQNDDILDVRRSTR